MISADAVVILLFLRMTQKSSNDCLKTFYFIRSDVWIYNYEQIFFIFCQNMEDRNIYLPLSSFESKTVPEYL